MLEPSPPAVHDEPWFADDPTERGEDGGIQVVSPVTSGDLLWSEAAGVDADWAREALHRMAERVISPARQRDNGKIGLRWTLGGFGTPYFGADAQIRVDGDALVIDTAAGQRRHQLTTLRDAAAAIGFDLDGADEQRDAGPLEVDITASRFIGDWFGFVTSVLEQLRAEAPPEWEPSRVQLWPEHFDVSVELGNEQAERRAACGGSPCDEGHAEPYLYVAPWTARPEGELWQASGFAGAELPYADLLAAPDQRGAALEFFRVRLAALNA